MYIYKNPYISFSFHPHPHNRHSSLTFDCTYASYIHNYVWFKHRIVSLLSAKADKSR